jgi:acyl dehydratase
MTDVEPTAAGEVAVSPWHVITQGDIDLFARATHDPDPMHVDPDWCRIHGPFPTTVAFGFLTLSLVTYFSHQALSWPKDAYALNYGLDKVRFVAPVPVGSRVRGRFTTREAEPRPDGSQLTRTGVVVEIEGQERPAIVAEWLGVLYPPAAQRKLVA